MAAERVLEQDEPMDMPASIPVYREPKPISSIANAVECEYMVYGTFRANFEVLEVGRDYAGTHLYVTCANGQVVRITTRTLTKEETTKYRNGDAP